MKLIKSIGNCRLSGFGASIYELKSGAAAVVFDKFSNNLPSKNNIRFNNVESAEKWVENLKGSNEVSTLRNVLRAGEISSF